MKSTLKFHKIGKIKPSKDFKEQAKKRLMQRIYQSEASWLENVLTDFQAIKPKQAFRFISKERLLHKISNPNIAQNWFQKIFLNKKFTSLATVCGILFTSILGFYFNSPQKVEASHSVYIVITEGNPLIKRLGENWEIAKQLQELKIGDTIQTDYNDVVEVHFFDNSVTRLANDTELTVTTFFKKDYTEKVELELNKGRTWNKVIQAVSNVSDFTVNTHNSSVSTKNATFDISSSENQPTAINVVDHLIDVKIIQSQNDNVVAKTKVAEGYKVEVQVSEEKTIAQTAQITPMQEKNNDLWFEDNLAKDKIHLDNLEKKREEKIIAAGGILPNSPLYPVKKGLKGAKDVVTNSNPAEKEIIKIKQKFQEAAALTAKQEDNAGETALQEFENLFLNAINQKNVKPELKKMLIAMQDDYLTALPGNSDYKIKELLRELELKTAEKPEEVLLKRTTEKLFEAQDLVDNGETELATNLLASMDLNFANVKNTNSGTTLAEDKKTIILQKTEELQLLQALQENIKTQEKEDENKDLIVLVDKLHQQTIQEIDNLTPKPPKQIKSPTKIVAVKKDLSKEEAQEFMDKVLIYKSERGQNNQITNQLERIKNEQKNLATLIEIKKLLPPEKQHLVTQKILAITGKK